LSEVSSFFAESTRKGVSGSSIAGFVNLDFFIDENILVPKESSSFAV
jgi:hypothetical protein